MATGFYLLDHSSTNNTVWQQWAYPRRFGVQLSGTCIMHTSESALDMIGPDATAESTAAFIASRTGSYGSYHDLVDSDSIIEMAPFEYEVWGDSETNPWAAHISAACRTSDWATMGDAKREGFYRNLAWCAADFVKYMRTKGIEVPRKRITGQQARDRVPGFCAHGDSGLFRTDPGADFDWARFFRYTDEQLSGGGINYQGGVTIISEDDELNAEQNAWLKEVRDRVMGREVQRYMNPANGAVSETNTAGWVPLRSADLHDVLTLHNLVNSNTQKVLDAVAALPGIDPTLIQALRDQLSAELKAVTDNLTVTLKVTQEEEPSSE